MRFMALVCWHIKTSFQVQVTERQCQRHIYNISETYVTLVPFGSLYQVGPSGGIWHNSDMIHLTIINHIIYHSPRRTMRHHDLSDRLRTQTVHISSTLLYTAASTSHLAHLFVALTGRLTFCIDLLMIVLNCVLSYFLSEIIGSALLTCCKHCW